MKFCQQEKGENEASNRVRAEANRYRCMRSGKGSKHIKMPGRCDGPKIGEMGEVTIWEVMTWSEEWTGREKF